MNIDMEKFTILDEMEGTITGIVQGTVLVTTVNPTAVLSRSKAYWMFPVEHFSESDQAKMLPGDGVSRVVRYHDIADYRVMETRVWLNGTNVRAKEGCETKIDLLPSTP